MSMFVIIEFEIRSGGQPSVKEWVLGKQPFPTREQAVNFLKATNPVAQWVEKAANVWHDGQKRLCAIVRYELEDRDDSRSQP